MWSDEKLSKRSLKLVSGEQVEVIGRYKSNTEDIDRYLITSDEIRKRDEVEIGELQEPEGSQLVLSHGLRWVNVDDIDLLENKKCKIE